MIEKRDVEYLDYIKNELTTEQYDRVDVTRLLRIIDNQLHFYNAVLDENMKANIKAAKEAGMKRIIASFEVEFLEASLRGFYDG